MKKQNKVPETMEKYQKLMNEITEEFKLDGQALVKNVLMLGDDPLEPADEEIVNGRLSEFISRMSDSVIDDQIHLLAEDTNQWLDYYQASNLVVKINKKIVLMQKSVEFMIKDLAHLSIEIKEQSVGTSIANPKIKRRVKNVTS